MMTPARNVPACAAGRIEPPKVRMRETLSVDVPSIMGCP